MNILQLARVAKCKATDIQSWNCGNLCNNFPNMLDIQVIEDEPKTLLAYTSYDLDSNNIIVAFRGTSNFNNWLYNLDFIQQDYEFCNGCKVHSGFQSEYKSLRDQVLRQVANLTEKYQKKYYEILVTGHSLGAAMATFCILDITRIYGPQKNFYTFASPRVGNEEFAFYFNQQIPYSNRLVHYKDIVPHMPMISMQYMHVATEIWYNVKNSTSYIECFGGEDQQCSNSVKIKEHNIHDHYQYLGMATNC